MSNDEPIVRPNLMHLDKTGGEGKSHGDGGCGCGGQGACVGGGRASRDYVVIEPVASGQAATQPEAMA